MSGLLLSGGMDSIAIAAWLKPQIAFTIDYGQRAAKAEIAASQQVCAELFILHEVISAPCANLGSGDMAYSEPLQDAPASDWWPFRNQLLITLAGMRCVALGIKNLMIGTVASDHVHGDGRQTFIDTMNDLLSAQEGDLQVSAPALSLSTVRLIEQSEIAPSLLAWAHSCHTDNFACGRCRGCVKHIEVTRELGGPAY